MARLSLPAESWVRTRTSRRSSVSAAALSGGRLEYNCDLRADAEARWLAAADVDAASLSAWEIVRATNLRAEQEERKRDARKQKRDEEAQMIVHTFKDTAIGQLASSPRKSIRARTPQ